eukprot:4364707-Amphidinium_carterae.5
MGKKASSVASAGTGSDIGSVAAAKKRAKPKWQHGALPVAKKPKQVGECVCSLCGVSSKDAQGKKMAEFPNFYLKNGCPQPQLTWFPFLSWEELTSKAKEGKDGVPHVVAQGRKILQAGKCDGAKGGSCKTKVQVAVEIERKFMVATLADMKRKADLERIPARALKYLPQVTLPDPETGDDESYYCFPNPDEKVSCLKNCTVKVTVLNKREIDGLRAEAFVSAEHSAGFLKDAVMQTGGKNDFDEWYESKFEKGTEDTGGNDLLWSGLKPEETSLVGPAALVFQQDPSYKTPLKPPRQNSQSDLSKNTSVQRMSSQEGMGSQSVESKVEGLPSAADAGGDGASITSAGATGVGVSQGW